MKADKYLEKVLKYVKKKEIVLDLGTGKGRNALFLAKNRFKVEAIDKRDVFINKNNSLIYFRVADINNLEFEKKYSLILAIFLLNILGVSNTKILFGKIKKTLLPKGIFYFTLFLEKKNSIEILKLVKNYFQIIESELEIIEDKHDIPHTHYVLRIIVKNKK